jgi:F-type H+-transporting ATPase subunit b
VDINATLFGQAITFGIFIWFTMKFVWPPIVQAMQDRESTIAEGLEAAKKGQKQLEQAQEQAHAELAKARVRATEIVDLAQKRGDDVIREAQAKAIEEGQRLLAAAQARMEQEMEVARQQLRAEVANMAMISAEKLLNQSLDDAKHRELIDQVVGEL